MSEEIKKQLPEEEQKPLTLNDLSFIHKKDLEEAVFRKHYQSGLNSAVFQVLDPEDINQSIHGVSVDGCKIFPTAVPSKVLRILGEVFFDEESAKEEQANYNLLKQYLSDTNSDFDHLAESDEILLEDKADLEILLNTLIQTEEVKPDARVQIIAFRKEALSAVQENREKIFMLCGLQDFIKGGDFDVENLHQYRKKSNPLKTIIGFENASEKTINNFKKSIENFVSGVMAMVIFEKKTPDLGGFGNAKVDKNGNIILVDINNILPCKTSMEDIDFKNNRQDRELYYSFQVLKMMSDYFKPQDKDLLNEFFDEYFEFMETWLQEKGLSIKDFEPKEEKEFIAAS